MSQFKVREVTPQQSLYGLCCSVTLVTLNRFLPAGISFLTACFLILLMTIANNCLKLLFSFTFFGRAWLWYPANLRLPFRSSLSYIQREINCTIVLLYITVSISMYTKYDLLAYVTKRKSERKVNVKLRKLWSRIWYGTINILRNFYFVCSHFVNIQTLEV